MKNWVHKYFSEEELKAIQDKISEVEKYTSGEMRLCLRQKRRLLERKLDLHTLALKEFHSLGMNKTKHKTGVLIFILFSERYFDIIADEGIHKKISDDAWKGIEVKLSDEFKKGNFTPAVMHVIETVGETLKSEFPRDKGDDNELSDEVEIE